MPLYDNLRAMERGREAYWLRYPATSPVKLRWRALTVRHCFHVLPGESVLELGAGSGLWTEHLAAVLRGENPLTAAVFHEDLARSAAARNLPNTEVRLVKSLQELPAESFDYVVGTAILCHDRYAENLRALHRLLKPGGQIFFFEANYWNPQVLAKSTVPAIRRWAGDADCQSGMRRYKLMQVASEQGFTHIQVIPYDIVHPRTPGRLVPLLHSTAFVLEHAPAVRDLCGTLYIWARRPGVRQRPAADLARHCQFDNDVSVVVPCHNEDMNIHPLVDALIRHYGRYIREILLVNDNSTDNTAAVVRDLERREPRVRLIDRTPPNGVGRALRDGYAAARGAYILSMDCDFAPIVPELRDLFDAVAAGHDGAIGSRFSHESVVINYPFAKIVSNRGFHALANLVLGRRFRDISNNLKLYRAEILKQIEIEEPHFAANAETGLKPMLMGYDVVEVPISWINRDSEMGVSSFRLAQMAPDYFRALMRILRRARSAAAYRSRAAVEGRGAAR